MVEQACTPSAGEVEAGGLQVSGQPGLTTEFQANLGFVARPFLRQGIKRGRKRTDYYRVQKTHLGGRSAVAPQKHQALDSFSIIVTIDQLQNALQTGGRGGEERGRGGGGGREDSDGLSEVSHLVNKWSLGHLGLWSRLLTISPSGLRLSPVQVTWVTRIIPAIGLGVLWKCPPSFRHTTQRNHPF